MIAAVLLALACGSDHQAEKVLRDPGAARALAPAPVRSTIAELGALPRTARRRAYIIDGLVVAIKHEADGDLHVILRDGTHQMIVELPDPRCSQGSLAIAAIRRARVKGTRLRVGMRVRVVGVLLIDHLHGQAGAAPNGAEIHPVLNVEVLR